MLQPQVMTMKKQNRSMTKQTKHLEPTKQLTRSFLVTSMQKWDWGKIWKRKAWAHLELESGMREEKDCWILFQAGTSLLVTPFSRNHLKDTGHGRAQTQEHTNLINYIISDRKDILMDVIVSQLLKQFDFYIVNICFSLTNCFLNL